MSDLRTNYMDDELAVSMEGKRKFNIVDSQGNVVYANVHIEDVSSYSNIGDEYGAAQINEQNTKINELSANLTASDGLALRFASDGEGNHGYLGADDSFIPFSGKYKELSISYWQVVNAGYGQAYGLTALFSAKNGLIGFNSGAGDYTGDYIRINSFYSAGVGWYMDLYCINDCTVRIHKNSSNVTETRNMTAGTSYRLMGGSTSTWVAVEVV